MSFRKAKIALVFDWMTTAGGAEKVNLTLHKMFPDAPIFTSVFNQKSLKGFENADIRTSFIQRLPFAKKRHQMYLGLMPHAFESFDLSEFDIVISSSHCCAKGVITKPDAIHISYCHTPMRYAWDDWHTYIEEYTSSKLLQAIAKRKMHGIRMWDKISADRVDYFIANSSTTKSRIQKYYRRPSTVIYPMINHKSYKIAPESKNYYLAVGRLIPYKKFDLTIEAFNKLGLPLKIVGTGIHEKELKESANSNIEFLGHVSDKELKKLYSECEALIFPQLEDFGITPLEAMASGKPVIAYKAGGALDTIVDMETGVFFEEQTAESLSQAVEKFIEFKKSFNPSKISSHAQNFDTKNFQKKLINFINEKWEKKLSR